MRKLKIGFVFDDSLDKPDGVQQYVLTLSRWLAGMGHDVHYLVGETKRTDLPNLYSLSRNIKVRFNQNRMAMPLPARMGPIRTVLRREQFDVLHVQVPYSPALAARIIQAADERTAVVGTFHVAPHSALVTHGNRLLALAVRRTLRRFDAMIAGTDSAAAFARKTFQVESEVVPHPIELSQFLHAKPFERYASSTNVVFLGRLVERKGCQHLLRAVAYARKLGEWPGHARVIICGGGPLEAQLKAYAREHQLHDIIEFTGYITEEDKPRYLAGADVAVYPSTGGESFGIVLPEAMAAARGEVLAGNNPGYASVMVKRPQALFDPKDTAAFASRLVAALKSKQVRADARAWQQEYVRRFDVNEAGKRVLQIYTEALQKRPS
ncbi:MAG TPA: glycosyltransferase family 4 protein [Candidatus Saccharimonadales bacterium]